MHATPGGMDGYFKAHRCVETGAERGGRGEKRARRDRGQSSKKEREREEGARSERCDSKQGARPESTGDSESVPHGMNAGL
eukprot:3081824-Rhodomonas_salina.1